ncbi:MAG: DUF3795 domain-containing protein [Anaerolineales bacterium]|nr:DUF3795 domain-containing protein [Anaerolineales bacterium]
MIALKTYQGHLPPCGIFCGGCPVYVRTRKPCPGAQASQRCQQKACRFQVCCTGHGVQHCCQCAEYPCQPFKRFARNWLKYGQDMLANQARLKELGEQAYLEAWNARAGAEPSGEEE